MRYIMALAAQKDTDDGPEFDLGTVFNTVPIPEIYAKAVNDPKYSKNWQKAIKAEVKALEANET